MEAGSNVSEACVAVGVSRTTVAKWASRGRAGNEEAAAFAEDFDAIRAADRELARRYPHPLRRG